jgi:hypothetical protein
MKESIANAIRMPDISRKISGIKVGTITAVDENKKIWVDFPGNTLGPVAARFIDSVESIITGNRHLRNKNVLLVYENDDPTLPIILGFMYDHVDRSDRADEVTYEIEEPKDVFIDGKRLTFNAGEEIVLRCGKSSITLTRAGKIIIRGAYLLNRSSGVNRIKGASVQIN